MSAGFGAVRNLDIVREWARILRTLLKKRFLRIGVTAFAVAAVLALAIVPAAHLHQSLVGKPLIHSHFLDNPVEHAPTLDHSDHHAVTTFASVFIAERTAHSVPAFTTITLFVLPTSETQLRGFRDVLESPVIHGPPLGVLSLRAPPA
jgi:hypothetical protein